MLGLGRYAGEPEELKKIAYAGIVHGNSIGWEGAIGQPQYIVFFLAIRFR